LQFLQHRIQPLKLFLKEASIPFQPMIDLLEWLRAEGVDAALGFGPYLNKPGVAQRSKMLRSLRLPDAKSFSDSPHRKRFAK
jgi:hypothetical protein